MSNCICEGTGNKVLAPFFSSIVQAALSITNVISFMSRFVHFVKAACEKMSYPGSHFYFLDISANRFCGNEGGVTSLRDGGALWAHARP